MAAVSPYSVVKVKHGMDGNTFLKELLLLYLSPLNRSAEYDVLHTELTLGHVTSGTASALIPHR